MSLSVTQAELNEMYKKLGMDPIEVEKENKYKNKKIQADGYKFDSKKEYQRYLKHKADKQYKLIKDFEFHPKKFILQPTFIDPRTKKTIRAITYTADFKVIHNDGSVVYEDTKGYKTDKFIIKYKMFLYKFPDIVLNLI